MNLIAGFGLLAMLAASVNAGVCNGSAQCIETVNGVPQFYPCQTPDSCKTGCTVQGAYVSNYWIYLYSRVFLEI